MPVDPLTLALIGGGSAVNAIGGLLGGASANRAGRQARDFADRDLLAGQGTLATSMYGEQASYLPTLRRLLGEAQQRNDAAGAANYGQQIASVTRPSQNSILGRLESTGNDLIRLQNNDLAGFDAESARLEQMLGGAANEQRAAGDRTNRLAAGAESLASTAGAGRDRIIRRDAGKRRKALDQTSRAALAGAGFGNTTAVGNAMAGNARTVAEQEDNALQASQDARLEALLGARERRINTGQQVSGANYNAATNVAQGAAARNSQRTGLRSAQLANEQTLRLLPMQTQIGLEQSSVANPYLGANTAQYYPGASGGANALASVGNTLSATGGINLMNQRQPSAEEQRMFDQASRMFAQFGPGGYGGWS